MPCVRTAAATAIRLREWDDGLGRTDEGRWTTPEMLELELWLIDSAVCGRASGSGVASPAAIESAISARLASLSAEQARMVRAICASGDRVELVEGVAGAGKTSRGSRTGGVAGIGLPSRRLRAGGAGRQAAAYGGRDRGLDDRSSCSPYDRQGSTGLDATTVLVVDEAAMVGTRKLARLNEYAAAAGTKSYW